MKFINYLLLLCFFIGFGTTFIACTDDDDDEAAVEITGNFTYKDKSHNFTTGILTFRGLDGNLRVYDLFLPNPGNNVFLNYRIYTSDFSFASATYAAEDDTENKMSGFSVSSYIYINGEKFKITDGKVSVSSEDNYDIIISCTDLGGNQITGSYTGALTYSNKAGSTGTMYDADGNSYSTALIANDIWTTSNLMTTKYNDGEDIISIDSIDFIDFNTPCYSWYDDDIEMETYGALYNYGAVSTGKLCPEGWHIPGEQEWADLIYALEGDTIAGAKIKEKGTRRWQEPNEGASNESDFTALPAGLWDSEAGYINLSLEAHFWSAVTDDKSATSYSVSHDSKELFINEQTPLISRRSVRCVKDK